ncbi:hypothetical protein LAZ67_18000724 [Cordylochernes scorpioides]|uniref:Uncharacterized protein n=1 Tax=Cordylochernes scorpioides TaxID=51811 RepID=A0ABY6LH89_9ARAC|nr:hypothetical protein LAZ67_18000724 [Cordylochernes scorpioides]
MEINQDSIGVKTDDLTKERGEKGGQEMTGREQMEPLAAAISQIAAALARGRYDTRARIYQSSMEHTARPSFFQTFDRKMEDASMGEQEKLLRLPNYLARQPLELFRKLRLADRSYFQVKQILLDLYPESSEASFAKYFAMKLTGQANLETYYREKTAMGLQLGLPQEVILETLTEGLPFSDQRLVRVVPPENLGEWFRLVQRIHGPSVPTTRPREDHPPTMSGPYHSTPRHPGAWNAPLPPSNCVKDANLAAARGDVTTGSAAATSSNGAARILGNWVDYTEDQGPGEDDDFTVVKSKKRRRDSPGSPAAAAPSSGTRGAGATRWPRSSTGWAPRAEEVRTTRAHIAEARARQASSTEDHCVFVERSPELEPYHYLRAIDRMFGSTREVFQVTKMNGHFLVGLANRGMAERLINEGLEVEGTLHRACPFRKRAERITVGNLPFFVGDAAVISALSSFGRVTSIAPKLMKAGPYIYNDGRREAFIILREGMTIERLPTRLDISIKGESWPAYLSSGIRCSRCRGQGHRRANCPLLAARTTAPGPATPTSPTSVPPVTAPGLPQQPSAHLPLPASPSPTMESPSASPAARAVTPSAAPRPSTPVAPAVPMEMAPPASPPVTPAPSLRAPGGNGPAAPTPDIQMSVIEETSTSSTSSSRTSTRESLVIFIERNPGDSFAGTDALGLGREEVLDLLSSKTRAQKNGPLLLPLQSDALTDLIGQLLNLKPGGSSNIYKILRQVKAEFRIAPAAVPPTPTLPAPRPSETTPPTSHKEDLTPALMTPPPPAPTDMEEDDPMTEEERCAPPLPVPRLPEPTPPTPLGEETTLAMATPPPPLPCLLSQVDLERKCEAQICDLLEELNYHQALKPLIKKGIDLKNLSFAIMWLESREYLLKTLIPRPRHRAILAGFSALSLSMLETATQLFKRDCPTSDWLWAPDRIKNIVYISH